MAENNNAHNPKMYTIPGKTAPAQQKYAQVQYTLETPMQTYVVGFFMNICTYVCRYEVYVCVCMCKHILFVRLDQKPILHDVIIVGHDHHHHHQQLC